MSPKIPVVGLLLGAALLFGSWLGARDLWDPNEPTYGRAVVEMAERGAWSVPTVNGMPFAEKPILYFWLARIAALTGGSNEASLRLPSALAGVAAVLLVYLLVLPYAGRRRGLVAAAILATTFIVFWSARSVQMDLLLAALTLAALYFAVRVVDHDAPPPAGWALAGAATGLGFLAKGPVGLIGPALVLGAYLAATRRLRRIVAPSVLAAPAAFLVVAAPWPLWLWLHGRTDVLVEMLYRQNVERFVAPWDHQAPWWYYLKYFWIDMSPWAFFVPLAWGLKPDDEREARLLRLAWCWIAVLMLFFSLSASKRSPYILPVAPALAVLVSALADRWLRGTLDRGRRRLALVVHGVLAVALLAGSWILARDPTWMHHPDPRLARSAWVTAIAAAAGGLAILVGTVLPRRRRFGAPVGLFGFVVTIYLLASAVVLPAANVFKSYRPFCEAVREHVGADAPLRGFYEWRWRAGYAFYSRREIPYLDSVDALREYWNRPERVFVIVERGALDEAREVIGEVEPLEGRAIGSNFAYLFANR